MQKLVVWQETGQRRERRGGGVTVISSDDLLHGGGAFDQGTGVGITGVS